MNHPDYTTSITVKKTPQEAFDAINQVSKWWTGEPGVEGSSEKIGDEFTYKHRAFHYTKQKVSELVPSKKVVWDVVESSINFVEDKNEWAGTQLIFEITPKGDQTEIHFMHKGLQPEVECYDACSGAWAGVINTTLRNFINTGKVEV